MKKYTIRKRGTRRWLPLLLICLLVTLAIGCGKRTPDEQKSSYSSEQGLTGQGAAASGPEENRADGPSYSAGDVTDGQEENRAGPDPEVQDEGTSEPGETLSKEQDDPEVLIEEDGVYTSAEDVALYLHTYGKLPRNFMTKSKAKKLGWNGGSLEEYAPGMCIGGGPFGNYEGALPEGNYRECDIDTLGRSKRGAKRLVYDDEGNIYYTEDHYKTFTQLYAGE